MRKYLATIAGIVMILNSPITVLASNAVLEQATDTAAEESSIADNDYTINYAYYSDEDWNAFCDKYIQAFENGQTDALDTIRGLIDSGGCSSEQIIDLLERGYFTEDIERYKYLRYIPEDYELPAHTVIHETPDYTVTGTVTLTNAEDADTTYIHTVDETLSFDAQKIMIDLMNDNVIGNAYVTCPVSSYEKHISGQMLYASSVTQDPLYVLFMSDDNDHAEYSWELGYCLYFKDNDLDLSVSYEEGRLDFDLGDTLPSGVVLHVYTGITDDNVRLNLKNSDGTIAYTLPVIDGYITLDNITKDGHYNISKAVVESNTSTSEESDDTQHTGVYQDISPLSNKAVLIVILILIGLGSVLTTYAVFLKNKR